ncbi:MAG: excinuclease ABC subunit C, partial [Eudoraea sp.]|nr:excinuclease ABC subunit C [Eudoraea sp.]
FGITFHRNKRSKAAINSVLEEIEGVGEKTALELLKNFKSVKRIKEASLEELAKIVGSAKAEKIYINFH